MEITGNTPQELLVTVHCTLIITVELIHSGITVIIYYHNCGPFDLPVTMTPLSKTTKPLLTLTLLAMTLAMSVEGQSWGLPGSGHPSVCTKEQYRNLPLKIQNEHQCLLMEQFHAEFFTDQEDRIRRYKQLDMAVSDIHYKLDRIMADLDYESSRTRDSKPETKCTSHSEATVEKTQNKTSMFKPNVDFLPLQQDCYDLQQTLGVRVSGVYPLKMMNGDIILAQCDLERAGGGWTVIQSRLDGSVNFTRNWTEYKYGFGNPNTEYWLGLEYIHLLTKAKNTSLRVDLWDWSGKRVRAEYTFVYISSETSNYTLFIHGHHGKAPDSLSYHNNCSFSTPERDNDQYDGSCAQQDQAGWWYKACSFAPLNNPYYEEEKALDGTRTNGIMWYHWKESYTYPLPRVEIKIRPAFM